MSIVLFRTPGALPLDACTTFGINAKPNSTNPFGFFGTGLKYAIAVILRHRGTIRFFIKGVEYEFYLHAKDFRGKEFAQVRMRKRRSGMLSWLKSTPLPFTTELGKNWKLWEAFRELESNTRDENGYTEILEPQELQSIDEFQCDKTGTDIVVQCDNFAECIGLKVRDHGGAKVNSCVFLAPEHLEVVFENDDFIAYEGASDHIYYQGIRVYDLSSPSRVTYNFKAGRVQLSEDRSAKNIWSMQYDIAYHIQRLQDVETIKMLLEQCKEHALWYETDVLSFGDNGMEHFRSVARLLQEQGGSRAIRGWYGAYGSQTIDEDDGPSTEIRLLDAEWAVVIDALSTYEGEEHIVQGLPEDPVHGALHRLISKIESNI